MSLTVLPYVAITCLLCIQRSEISYQRGCCLITMYQLITAIKLHCDLVMISTGLSREKMCFFIRQTVFRPD